VKFQSQAEFQKSITTESKMFSIYAVGVKKGYKRDTRIRIHSVVDFRNAPSLSGAPTTAGTGTTGTSPLPTPATGASAGPSTTKVDPNAVAGAVQPSTGGQVVYYRIE
jgi:general secretion pathway protein K